MRVMWGSNAPFAPSGYGVQTGLLLPRLTEAGYEVAVACNWGLDEGTMGWSTPHGDVLLYPKGPEQFSAGILGLHAQHFQADVVMTHYDAWVFDPVALARPWVPWFPVDCEEVPENISSRVQHAALRITQTHHGVAALSRRGLDAEYVPAAFDGSVYYPRDGSVWRERTGIDQDRFVIAVVAANNGLAGAPSRKAYPQIFAGFKQFLEDDPDALLYVHAHVNGQISLEWLRERYQIPTRNIATAHSYYLHTGAYTGDEMAGMYSAADVLLNPSMGEGFGVPIIEAQACGTPVITGDWTSMSEITRAGLAIPKSEAYPYPIVGYGDMWLVRPEAIRNSLVEAQEWQHDPAEVSSRVAEYEINRVWTDQWVPVFQKLGEVLRPAGPNREQRRRKVKMKDAVA